MTDKQMDLLTRADRDIIVSIVPEKSRVLDLGCGDGGLLAELKEKKHVNGQGIDIDEQNLIRCMERGLCIYHGDLDEGLADFPDNSCDYVILNQTLQVITQPRTVIREMLRIGKFGIVGFPNFGHWSLRLNLLKNGRMPKSRALPFEWHDTPNIHQLTINDFHDFCEEEKITIIRQEFFMLGKWRCSGLINPLANLLALTGMFVIRKD